MELNLMRKYCEVTACGIKKKDIILSIFPYAIQQGHLGQISAMSFSCCPLLNIRYLLHYASNPLFHCSTNNIQSHPSQYGMLLSSLKW